MNDNYLTGLVSDMSNEVYHSQIHIGSSGFKLLEKSPAHLFAASYDPKRERKPATRFMQIGTAWHTGIWEPHLFESSYAVKPDIHPATTQYKVLEDALTLGTLDAFKAKYTPIPDGLSKSTKEGKALMAELAEKNLIGVEQSKFDEIANALPGLLGKMLFSKEDLDGIRAMSAAAHNHPVTQVIFGLPGGMGEHSIFWVDKATGAPCRIRPDYAVPPCKMFPTGLIVDGKTSDDASREGFARSAWNSQMYYQAAFYSDGFQQHFGTKEPPAFAWLAQEREKPHATQYHRAPPAFVEFGRRKYRRLLPVFAECLRTGQWPGYAQEVRDLALPIYAEKAITDELAA